MAWCYPFCVDSCKDTELVCVKCHTVKAKIPANCCWSLDLYFNLFDPLMTINCCVDPFNKLYFFTTKFISQLTFHAQTNTIYWWHDFRNFFIIILDSLWCTEKSLNITHHLQLMDSHLLPLELTVTHLMEAMDTLNKDPLSSESTIIIMSETYVRTVEQEPHRTQKEPLVQLPS